MKISELLPTKKIYCKSAKIKKQGCDTHLLRIIIREIEKSFLFTCKNMENWKLDAKTDKEYVYLEISCQGEKKDERV